MTLTFGPAPLSTQPAGDTNYAIDGPRHRLLFEDHPRRIRALLGGRTVLDTVRGKLLHESNIAPVLYVPREDVDESLLEPTEHTTHCPFKGDATYSTIRVGDSVAENAVWGYPAPQPDAAWLDGHVAVYWAKMDTWLEEDEEVLGHLRDPYHRVDVRDATRHVRVIASNGDVLAETEHPKMVFETCLPPRPYIPPEDVRTDLLRDSDTHSICPYKGTASYWSLDDVQDVAWGYPEPLPESVKLEGAMSFDESKVTVEVSEAQPAVAGWGSTASPGRGERERRDSNPRPPA